MTEIVFTSSVLILVMALARLVLRKRVSQRLIYGLWLLVALRLLIPVQFGQSRYSLNRMRQCGHPRTGVPTSELWRVVS